jgi:hypothetical protein
MALWPTRLEEQNVPLRVAVVDLAQGGLPVMAKENWVWWVVQTEVLF